MTKRIITSILAAILTCTAALAQFTPAPVSISKKKVKIDGNQYYVHTVLEKQTLYSIAREYGASLESIYEANDMLTTYDLRNHTLEAGYRIYIPVTKKKGAAAAAEAEEEPAYVPHEPVDSVAEATDTSVDTLTVADTLALADTSAIAVQEPAVVEEPDKSVDIMLLLPFKVEGTTSARNYMDFYSGVLLAAREVGLDGTDLNLSVYDCAGGIPDISEEEFRHTDLVIGPVSPENMEAMLGILPEDKFIVSPMDPRTDSLAHIHHNLIQVRGSQEAQYADIVKWVARDYAQGDGILILNDIEKTDYVEYVQGLLDDAGLPYQTYSYGKYQGKAAMYGMRTKMVRGKMNHIILISDAELFTNDAVKNTGLAADEGLKVRLYCQSKARSFETTDPEMMFKANMHVTRQYDIDYNDIKTKDFLLKYRAVFQTEPTSFAYQGHDIIMYFATLISNYRDNWEEMLDKDVTERFIQTDFNFDRICEDGGYVNTALRHEVVHGEDIQHFKAE